jgi:hypothetical protein
MTTRIYVITILFLLVVRSLPYEGDVSISYSTLASYNRTPSPSIAALSVGLLVPAVVDTRTFTTAIGAGDTVPIYTILCAVCLYVSANLDCESELEAEAEAGTRRAIIYLIARSAAALAEEDAQGQEGDDGRSRERDLTSKGRSEVIVLAIEPLPTCYLPLLLLWYSDTLITKTC